ncbi:MAG: M23 family metallopeptidase [Bdellovibrionales bacterium]|nr:M23 family metallopeptidase [Bdellovibrionales bacterium]
MSTGKNVSSKSAAKTWSSDSHVWVDLRRALQGFVVALIVFSFITVLNRRKPDPVPDPVPAVSEQQVGASDRDLSEMRKDLMRREAELRQRAEYLDAVLSEAGALDLGSEIKGEGSTFPIEFSEDDGMGGGYPDEEFSHTERYLEYSRKNPAALSDTAKIDDFVDAQIRRLQSFPLGSPVPEARITSQYGQRRSPFSGRWGKHHGIDFAAHWRSKVVSTADGVVVNAGATGAYGRQIKINHGNGIETVYGHLSRIKVRVGDKVCRGETIGLLGSTGRSTGPHLHYEVRIDGKPINPKHFVQLAGLLKLL